MGDILLNIVINFLVLNSISIDVTKSWNLLNTIGLNTSEIPIRHVTILKNKAYLSIPRIKDDQKITFIEAPWPENSQNDINSPTAYRKEKLQIIGNCDNLQSVICSDTDTLGRLYILDKGLDQCPPKIVVYDTSNRKKAIINELTDINGSNLQNIVVDSLSIGGPRAYIGLADNEGIIIYSLRGHQWWFIKLSVPAEFQDNHTDKWRVETQQLALSRTKPLLYITSNNTNFLFSVNAAVLRVIPVPPNYLRRNIKYPATKIDATLEGEKIGPSQGLASDLRGGLYYFIPRDYVLVRWDTHHLIKAENHDVILQSATILPQVEQIFIDTQSQVWALLGVPNNDGKYCIKLPKTNVSS
ncbi:uncharacterized protein LOC142329946 isoform X1 [Lycorma delicatula]|uniref:uncharacterized protein LOC142329946 isoform X1 n=1 Tax=Lycorma delicatula TaxID=130591 RepID=UPI003F50F9DC